MDTPIDPGGVPPDAAPSTTRPRRRTAAPLSPYLMDPSRLTDVVAAIQAMGIYKFYKLPFAGWADRISANPAEADKWEAVFVEHPEFFRLDSARQRASLVWRRQFPKRYDVDTGRTLSYSEFDALGPDQKARVSRIPLAPDDIKALVDTAVNLHSRALEHQRDKRWWFILLASAGGGVLAAVIGAAFK